jgi:hypothetical protein
MVMVIPILHSPLEKQFNSLSAQGSGNSVPRILSKQVSLVTDHRAETRKVHRENCRKSIPLNNP